MKSKTVLIVDRNKLLLESLAEIFSLNGYKVITADSGAKALGRAQLDVPELVICDVLLPELNGYELYLHLQAKLPTKNIPVIFFIAETSNAQLLQTRLNVPKENIVYKPFAVEDLLDVAQNAIAKFDSPTPCSAGSWV